MKEGRKPKRKERGFQIVKWRDVSQKRKVVFALHDRSEIKFVHDRSEIKFGCRREGNFFFSTRLVVQCTWTTHNVRFALPPLRSFWHLSTGSPPRFRVAQIIIRLHLRISSISSKLQKNAQQFGNG
jgi:hypothetical protein